MIKKIALLGMAGLLFTACQEGGNTTKEVELTSNEDSLSYAFGYIWGKEFEKQPIDSVNEEIFVSALKEGMNGEEGKIGEEEVQALLTTYFKGQEEKKRNEALVYKEEGEKFLEENKEKEGVQVTESGLQYKVIEKGDGPTPERTDRVQVHYHGTLIDGTVFDSSVERGEPVVFGVSQVIPGWTEALLMMPVGSKYELYIPHNLAYGPRPQGKIEAFSTLIFEVELLDIVDESELTN